MRLDLGFPSAMNARTAFLANVKDEPRPERARLVRRDNLQFAVSFQFRGGSTRRDRSGRWLWRLVRLLGDHRALRRFESTETCRQSADQR